MLCSLSGKRGETTKFNMKQLKLSNLSLGTSEEDIENFLLKLGQEDPQTIKFSHDNTAAMVGFQNNIGISYQIIVSCMQIQIQQVK